MGRGEFAALCVLGALTSVSAGMAQSKADFKNWPKGASPTEVGKKVADHFVVTPHTNFNRSTPPRSITYPETCTWYGALEFAKESGDKKLAAHPAQSAASLPPQQTVRCTPTWRCRCREVLRMDVSSSRESQ